MGWGRRRGSISKGNVPGKRDSAPPHAPRPGCPSRPPPLARRPGFEPGEPGAGSNAAAGMLGAPGAGGRGPAEVPARGVPGGRGAPAALTAPRGDPGPPPAAQRGDAQTRPELAGRRAGRGRAGDGTKAPLLSGGRRRVTHNGASRLRRRRARRGALPSRPPARPAHVHTHTHGTSPSHRGSAGPAGSPQCRLRSPAVLAAAASPRLSLCRSRRHVTPTRERGRGRGGAASWSHAPRTSQAHSTGSPAPGRPRAPARAGISNACDWGPRAAGVAREARGLLSRLRQPGEGGGLLCLATCPSTRAQSDQNSLTSVYCAPTTRKALGSPR